MPIASVSDPEEGYLSPDRLQKDIKSLKKEMRRAAKRLDFEEAARLRNRISSLENKELAYRDSP